MNLELEVRKRVKDNYGSAQNFVKCIGIPYSTYASGLKRGILTMTKANADLILDSLGLNSLGKKREEIKMNELINIQDNQGRMVVRSQEVAENFGKRHTDVLRKIEQLEIDIQPTQNCVRYFIVSEYKDAKGETRKEYLLTRDGFSLLVMGFTGKRALEWKLKYIEAFNKMEEALKNSDFITQEETALPSKRQAFEDNIALAEDCIRRFGADPGMAYSIAMNEAEKDCGKSLEAYKTLLPDATEEKGTMNATMLGKLLGHLGPREVNKMLEKAGFQNKKSDGWEATEKGLKYCTMVPYTNNGHSSYRPLWKKNVVPVLQSIL